MLRIHKKIFTIFGMIYVKKKTNLLMGLSLFVQLCILAVFDVLNIFYSFNDLERLIWVLEITFLVVAINLKIGTMYWQCDKIEFMFHFVEQHLGKVPEQYVKFNHIVTYSFNILVAITIIIYNIKPFSVIPSQAEPIRLTQFLIYPTWLPFETNTFTHSLILMWQFGMGLYASLLLCVWDTFVFSLMIFISGQLRYIHVSVKNLPMDADLFKKQLIGLIHHHQSVIR